MKLTLEQALQKGIEARKNGQIQKADKHFTDILGVQPRHAHANHNMGLLAESASNAQAALVFFKTALESRPKNNQFWLRYIGALIKLDHISDARDALSQAQDNGIKRAGLDRLKKAYTLSTHAILDAIKSLMIICIKVDLLLSGNKIR